MKQKPGGNSSPAAGELLYVNICLTSIGQTNTSGNQGIITGITERLLTKSTWTGQWRKWWWIAKMYQLLTTCQAVLHPFISLMLTITLWVPFCYLFLRIRSKARNRKFSDSRKASQFTSHGSEPDAREAVCISACTCKVPSPQVPCSPRKSENIEIKGILVQGAFLSEDRDKHQRAALM